MHKELVAVIFSIFLVFVLSPAAYSQEKLRQIETTENADYFGFDLRAEKDITLEQCKSSCIGDDQCRAFTYNSKVSWCFLKSDFNEIGEFEGAIAGKIVEIANEPDLGAPEVLSFVPTYRIRQAVKFKKKTLSATTRNEGQNTGDMPGNLIAAGTTAFVSGDYTTGKNIFAAALSKSPDSRDIWISYADAIQNYYAFNAQTNYQMDSVAVSVAINAYQLTRRKTPRAKMLTYLARGLERENEFRPALETYKKSLALLDLREVSDEFRRLRESKGFRVTGNTVDTETNTPRVCIQFSEPLVKSGVDYATFITVDGKPARAIEVTNKQICVEGLQHGKTYRVGIRSGLPSTVDEVLEKPAIVESYVRDRTPSVRFDGAKFVLPSAGRQAIPIIGINAKTAELELYRVGERALPALLAQTSFLSQLSGYSFDNVQNDFSELVWEGTIELTRTLNREATTGFDVNKALPKRKPGIYILKAGTSEGDVEDWDRQATQWFLISDIGLATIWGENGLNIFARSLETAKPLANTELTLIARNNEILGTVTTGNDGNGKFDSGLMLGSAAMEPSILVAKTGEKDFVFLDLNEAGFDLSDRGVEGREAPGPIDIFIYNERGIYRAGETVHSVALLRNDMGGAEENLPITIIYTRPDGVEAGRVVSTSGRLGGHAVSFDIPDNAMLGTWTLRVYTDPENDPLSEKLFLVEDFTPERSEVKLSSSTQIISPDNPAEISVDGRYLYGAPASGLKLEAEVHIRPVHERSGFKGYKFGLADENNAGKKIFAITDMPVTDARGQAVFDARIGATPSTTRPLTAKVIVTMAEEGGKSVEESLDFPVKPNGVMIGIRPDFSGEGLEENSQATFSIIAVDPDGNRVGFSGLKWSLYQIEKRYQWYREGSRWRYEPVEIPRLAGDGNLDASAEEILKISSPVTAGEYRLEVESGNINGPATSVTFSAGWFVSGDSAQTPDALEMAFGKEKYGVGETAILNVTTTSSGEMIIAIGAGKLLETFDVSVEKGKARLEIPVKPEWGAGVYVTATLLRAGQDDESHMPVRAIGTVWMQIDPGKRKLDVKLDMPDKIRPNNTLEVAVRIDGLEAGEEAFVTVAAVDVGILNLTSYTLPQPSRWIHGQRAMGLELRDIYGRLIDGSKGALGHLRSGGDGPGLVANGEPPTEKLLAFFSGAVKTDSDGVARVEFDLQQFNGTARVMAIAWTRKGVGSVAGDVIIRDPIVVSASVPKVMAPGDKVQTIVSITNTDAGEGEYSFAIAEGEIFTVDQSGIPASFSLKKGERKSFVVPLSANLVGKSLLQIVAKFEGERIAEISRILNIRPSTLPVTTKTKLSLAANGSVTIDKEMLADRILQGAKVSINVSTSAAFDVPALLMKLDTYPYGCAEQTTSKALPLLYMSDLGSTLLNTKELNERVEGAIKRVLSYQSASGSFGLWAPGNGDLWLDSYITDFLTRANEKGFKVPRVGMRLALNNLQNTIGYSDDINSELAYALYVLSRNRLASASDLRYYADSRLEEFDSPLARAHIAASLSLYNDIERANRVFASAFELTKFKPVDYVEGANYGSYLRDDAAMLVLASESRPVNAMINSISDLVVKELELRQHTSTQENAWLLLASRTVKEQDSQIVLDINGAIHNGAYQASIAGEALAEEPLFIVNNTGEELAAVVTTIASPRQPLTAGGEGFTIKREYYDLKGNRVQLNDVTQNERFVVVLDIEELSSARETQIIVTDLLPGGFEIDNPRIINSAELSAFEWLGETGAVHTEFRSDRFVAAFEGGSNNEGASMRVAYLVRAVTAGTYIHPAATVEDMYRPRFQARTSTGFLEIKPAR